MQHAKERASRLLPGWAAGLREPRGVSGGRTEPCAAESAKRLPEAGEIAGLATCKAILQAMGE
jgi:hypothetical protein